MIDGSIDVGLTFSDFLTNTAQLLAVLITMGHFCISRLRTLRLINDRMTRVLNVCNFVNVIRMELTSIFKKKQKFVCGAWSLKSWDQEKQLHFYSATAMAILWSLNSVSKGYVDNNFNMFLTNNMEGMMNI